VPFSNRIRDGRFAFGEHKVALAPNFPPQRHAIHGRGWRAPWRVLWRDEARLTIEHVHDPGDWPWAYRARQDFALGAEGLEIAISVRNESPEPMPAGLGLHPYFPRTPRATIRAEVAGFWQTDEEVMPTIHSAPPAGADPAHGIDADRVVLDNVFTGWDRTAVLEWPERDARLTLRASEALGFLVIFTPGGQEFFCVEPVSHCTDALNLAAAGADGTGMVALAPGAELSATVTLSPGTGRLDRMPDNP
jgi:aldose 1-epimerase